ncbi:unnamed protein product [Pleuronectes platessa]|uniref:Uncharacterized protein n=1 Tax=Pleuronectes platessa TaxID=8262 RepID=A0A9N7U3J7_PLEPL|nr:unnamed protein product [Pleuronectes platessa]
MSTLLFLAASQSQLYPAFHGSYLTQRAQALPSAARAADTGLLGWSNEIKIKDVDIGVPQTPGINQTLQALRVSSGLLPVSVVCSAVMTVQCPAEGVRHTVQQLLVLVLSEYSLMRSSTQFSDVFGRTQFSGVTALSLTGGGCAV